MTLVYYIYLCMKNEVDSYRYMLSCSPDNQPVSWTTVDYVLCNMDTLLVLDLILGYGGLGQEGRILSPSNHVWDLWTQWGSYYVAPVPYFEALIPSRQIAHFICNIIFCFHLGAYDPAACGMGMSANAGIQQTDLQPIAWFSLLLSSNSHCLFLLLLFICCVDWDRAGRAQQFFPLHWCIFLWVPRVVMTNVL